MIARNHFVRPAFNCWDHQCLGSCPGVPRSSPRNHGRGSETWNLRVGVPDSVLSLSINTQRMLPQDQHIVRPDEMVEGRFLSLHTAFPWGTETTLKEYLADDGFFQDCEYVDTGRCFCGYEAGLGAVEFWKEHGITEPSKLPLTPDELPESFWLALEAEWAEHDRDARAQRFDQIPEVRAAQEAVIAALQTLKDR